MDKTKFAVEINKDKELTEEEIVKQLKVSSNHKLFYEEGYKKCKSKVELYFAKCMLNKKVPRLTEIKEILKSDDFSLSDSDESKILEKK